jgi:hypothetical protein
MTTTEIANMLAIDFETVAAARVARIDCGRAGLTRSPRSPAYCCRAGLKRRVTRRMSHMSRMKRDGVEPENSHS